MRLLDKNDKKRSGEGSGKEATIYIDKKHSNFANKTHKT